MGIALGPKVYLLAVESHLINPKIVAISSLIPHQEQDATERTLRRRGCGTD